MKIYYKLLYVIQGVKSNFLSLADIKVFGHFWPCTFYTPGGAQAGTIKLTMAGILRIDGADFPNRSITNNSIYIVGTYLILDDTIMMAYLEHLLISDFFTTLKCVTLICIWLPMATATHLRQIMPILATKLSLGDTLHPVASFDPPTHWDINIA